MHIAGIEKPGAAAASALVCVISAHEGHVLGKLVVLVLVQHLLHVAPADHRACVHSTCQTHSLAEPGITPLTDSHT